MGVPGNYFSADYTKLSHASCNISVGGYEVKGITEFTFSETIEAPPQYANGSVSQGAPVGKHSAEGTIGMFSASAAYLRQVLGGGWGTAFVSVVNTLFETNGNQGGAGILTYTATRVRIGKLEFKSGGVGGSDSAIETFSLTIHDPIQWDGIPSVFLPGSLGGGLPVALPSISLSF